MNQNIILDDLQVTIVELEVHSDTVDNKSVLDCEHLGFEAHEENVGTDVEKLDLVPEIFLDFVYFLHLHDFGSVVVVLHFDVV